MRCCAAARRCIVGFLRRHTGAAVAYTMMAQQQSSIAISISRDVPYYTRNSTTALGVGELRSECTPFALAKNSLVSSTCIVGRPGGQLH